MENNSIGIHVIRSARKSFAVEIRRDSLTVRAPLQATDAEIGRFLMDHRQLIDKHLQKARERERELSGIAPLTKAELRQLADQAVRIIPERVRHYAPLIGVTYGRITIRNQRTRWGSCSSQGNLNFNCLLMLTPPEVIVSVVVHELCHRKEMNHSERFYAEVLRVFPEYRKWNQWLRDHGPELMKRMG